MSEPIASNPTSNEQDLMTDFVMRFAIQIQIEIDGGKTEIRTAIRRY
jgi:hypothetical protein